MKFPRYLIGLFVLTHFPNLALTKLNVLSLSGKRNLWELRVSTHISGGSFKPTET